MAAKAKTKVMLLADTGNGLSRRLGRITKGENEKSEMRTAAL